MTPRWERIGFLVIALAWLTLGTFSLTKGDTGQGVIQLTLGVGGLLVAALKGIRRPS